MSAGKASRAFTLLEIIVVLLLIGILGAVALSRMPSTSVYSVRSEAAALKGYLRYAQTMAMSTNRIWGIHISDSKHYALFRNNVTSDTVILPGADGNPVALPSNGPALSTVPITIRFDGMGSPVDASGSAITSTPAATITVSSGSESQTISITRNTGFIP